MTGCPYCRKEVTDGDCIHFKCDLEWRRRDKEGICVKCGKNEASEANRPWCDTCDATSEYMGYPGVSA